MSCQAYKLISQVTNLLVDRPAITSAYEAIRPYVRLTPTLEVHARDVALGDFDLVLKLEMLQHAGSFKARGAFANLLLREIPKAGVVAASGGNHGVAVAYAAMRRNVPARIFVPDVASPSKVQRIRSYGADLVVGGKLYGEALAASQEWVAQSGAMPIHAYDHRDTLRGTGTVGLELSSQSPYIDTVLVAVGGGGLIGGIAAWFGGSVKVIGVEPENAPTLTTALAAGKPVDAPAAPHGVASDSLAPYRVGELMFPIAKQFVSEVLLVSDAEIRKAQEFLWTQFQIVAEPGGAAAFAALLSKKFVPQSGSRVAVVICGANTTAVNFTT